MKDGSREGGWNQSGMTELTRHGGGKDVPDTHRTIDRVTRILEEVVYAPGLTFSELVRALGASKSSVHGFIQGLLAKGWLYEEQRSGIPSRGSAAR
jgi:hypothetical protein